MKTLFFLYFWTVLSWGNVLVLEYKHPTKWEHHGQSAKHIACHKEPYECHLYYSKDFSENFVKDTNELVKNVSAVNMSFSIQEPELVVQGPPDRYEVAYKKHQENLKNYKVQKKNIGNLIANHPDVLFSIASGNGYDLGFVFTPGIPVGKTYPQYPALYELSNKVVVAAVLSNGKLAKYSNFSLWNVDLASYIEENHEGERLKGTSFASPVVAKYIARLRFKFPELTALEVKEMLMKTSVVKNIDLALKFSQHLKDFGEESYVYKAHRIRISKVREEFLKKAEGILLVKSGGIVDYKTAELCARIFLEAGGILTVENSCLEAQSQLLGVDQGHLRKLKKLWSLRGF